jgi:hypothetical protein
MRYWLLGGSRILMACSEIFSVDVPCYWPAFPRVNCRRHQGVIQREAARLSIMAEAEAARLSIMAEAEAVRLSIMAEADAVRLPTALLARQEHITCCLRVNDSCEGIILR